jgi:hypothetical protein
MSKAVAAAPPVERLMSTGEVDRTFRLAKGTAFAACSAGLIRCAKRQMRGRDTYFIAPSDAMQQWGPK